MTGAVIGSSAGETRGISVFIVARMRPGCRGLAM